MTITLSTKQIEALEVILNTGDIEPIVQALVEDWAKLLIETHYKKIHTTDEIVDAIHSKQGGGVEI